MSIFYCHQCDNLRDADDGCEEIAGALVCVDCAELEEDDIAEAEA